MTIDNTTRCEGCGSNFRVKSNADGHECQGRPVTGFRSADKHVGIRDTAAAPEVERATSPWRRGQAIIPALNGR